MALRTGDWVEVRSKAEILRSLDENGRLENLPFMPQMFQYCGQRFRVYRSAHKTCDTVNPVAGRRLSRTVHLETRCDGKAYGGCQAACLIFWKEAWLKAVSEEAHSSQPPRNDGRSQGQAFGDPICTEEVVHRSTCAQGVHAGAKTRYFCQATELPHFTAPLRWWDITQYVRDYTSGNVTIGRLVAGAIFSAYNVLARRRRIGRPARWLYDQYQRAVGGVPYPRRAGTIPPDQPTPVSVLNLEPGELVRVRSYREILSTLDTNGKNRGMAFDAELVPYCGGVFRVKARVARFVDERTGMLTSLKTPAVILEGVWCQSRYSHCRMGCPRSIYSWWREIWLERVSSRTADDSVH